MGFLVEDWYVQAVLGAIRERTYMLTRTIHQVYQEVRPRLHHRCHILRQSFPVAFC